MRIWGSLSHKKSKSRTSNGRGQPEFRGPRPAGRGGDTPDTGRVATCNNTIQYNTNDFLLDNEPSTKFNRKWIITAYKQTYTRNKK